MATKTEIENATDKALEMVTIRLPRTKADIEDQVVCVNNHDFIIQRGVDVEVPRYVATALKERDMMYETIMLFDSENASK